MDNPLTAPRMPFPLKSWTILFLTAALTAGQAQEALTILRDECLRCHNEDKRKGGLMIHTREKLLEGGDTGPGIVSGQGAKSLLVELLSESADPHMPPKSQLTEAQISTLKKWIDAGAPWNAELLKETRPIAGANGLQVLPEAYQPITTLRSSPDGTKLAIGKGDRIEVYDFSVEPAKKVAVLEGQRDAIQSLTWSPDGKVLASGGYHRVFVWDTGIWERIAFLEDGLRGRVTALAFTVDGKRLIAADSVPASRARLQVWDTANWKALQTVDSAHMDTIYALDVRPDGKQIATASADKLIHLWDAATLKRTGTLEGHTGYVLAAAFSPQNDRIATAGDDESVRVWSLDTGKQISSFGDRRPTGAVTSLFWILDPARKDPPKEGEAPPDWIVAVSEDSTPRVYTDIVIHEGAQTSAGAKMRAWAAGDSGLNAVSFLKGKQLVVAGGENGKPFAWDAAGKSIPFTAPEPSPKTP